MRRLERVGNNPVLLCTSGVSAILEAILEATLEATLGAILGAIRPPERNS